MMPIASGKKERSTSKPVDNSSQNLKRIKIRIITFEVHKDLGTYKLSPQKKTTFRDCQGLSGTRTDATAFLRQGPEQTSNRPSILVFIPTPSLPLVPYSLRVLLRGLTPCAKNLSCAGRSPGSAFSNAQTFVWLSCRGRRFLGLPNRRWHRHRREIPIPNS